MSLINLTAVQARAELDKGEISPEALLEAVVVQIESENPVLNAICTTAIDRARSEAIASGQRLSSGRSLGVLEGLPVAIKDNQLTEGIRTARGSPLYAQDVPAVDAGIVARIRDAGGIVVGKTNIPELSIGANTVNPLFGATGNPFNPALTCGGSSGGSAVAVASHMVPLATGSDHGGSLRIPASYCGVVGFRATPGVVPNEERTISQTNYSVQGPIARNVQDAALLLSVIAARSGTAKRDPMAFPLDATHFATLDEVATTDLRVALSADLGGLLVSESNQAIFRQRMAALASHFGSSDWHDIDLTPAPGVDWLLRQDVFATQYVDQAANWPAEMNPNVLATYQKAAETSLVSIAAARREQMRLYHRLLALFDDFDVLIVPGMSIPPFPWKDLNPQSIDGKPVENYMAWLSLTATLTVVGHPVVTLPCGLDEQGTPFGIQVVGAPYSDHRLLSIAAAIEAVMQQNPLLARPLPPAVQSG